MFSCFIEIAWDFFRHIRNQYWTDDTNNEITKKVSQKVSNLHDYMITQSNISPQQKPDLHKVLK